LFNDVLRRDGAVLFESSARLIRDLKSIGKKIAVVTSSKNCDSVLQSVGMDGLFDAQMDGNIAAAHNIAGKPKPGTYIAAAGLLDVAVKNSVVIEDAVSGVQAGQAGGFGLVIGIDRHGGAGLEDNGADIVVRDLAEITF
jgi:alpha,alpha-trehalase